ALEEPVGDARRAARPRRDLPRGLRRYLDAEDAGGADDHLFQVLRLEQVEAVLSAEAVAERGRQPADARRRADEREPRQPQAQRAGTPALAEDDVEMEVLHPRVEPLLGDGGQAV